MKELILLVCIGQLVLMTEAQIIHTLTTCIQPVCLKNQNADSLIHGDSTDSVQNFLDVIRASGEFILFGSECRQAIDDHRRRKFRKYNGTIWILDCWEPAECLMEDKYSFGHLFIFFPVTLPSLSDVKVRTVFLPIDEYETISYTFLPSATRNSITFVTVMLSGCSVFVAKPDNMNCNLVVLHANYRCDDRSAMGIDYNHQQAMAVLEEVESTNCQCTYQIERRWAADYWRPAIEAEHYDYGNRVFYYNWFNGENFLYGNHLGGYSDRWQFCIRVSENDPPPETCYYI